MRYHVARVLPATTELTSLCHWPILRSQTASSHKRPAPSRHSAAGQPQDVPLRDHPVPQLAWPLVVGGHSDMPSYLFVSRPTAVSFCWLGMCKLLLVPIPSWCLLSVNKIDTEPPPKLKKTATIVLNKKVKHNGVCISHHIEATYPRQFLPNGQLLDVQQRYNVFWGKQLLCYLRSMQGRNIQRFGD